MQDTLFNKVANSGLITIDLEKYYPSETFISFDLKQFLFMELILKKKQHLQERLFKLLAYLKM